MANSVPSKFNVYEAVTNKIVAMIEAGTGAGTVNAPWHVPGHLAVHPTNAATHAEYRGVNVLGLWVEAQVAGYASNLWASYRQWQTLGAQVRKGEHGALIVFYKRLETTAAEEGDDELSKLRYVARASWVFNLAQVDGYIPPDNPMAPELERIREVEAFVEAVQARIEHGHTRACYNFVEDVIRMPNAEWFVETESSSSIQSYYAVLLHELTHWVGGPKRLNRQLGMRFGEQAYAMEELIAELGAAFMCAAFGISTEPRPDHATYVASWLEVLKSDSRAIFAAASRAQEAFEHLAYLATKPDDRAA